MIDEKVLIERLKELGWVYTDYYPDETVIHRQRKKSVAYDEVVEIVNQLAEEKDFEIFTKEQLKTIEDMNVNTFERMWKQKNNDCCEWKLDGVYLQCPHKKLYISCLAKEQPLYNYCPICGKKIKVVEQA